MMFNNDEQYKMEIRQMKDMSFFEDIPDLAASKHSLSTPEISKGNNPLDHGEN
jgi:hypothetical protein